MLVGRGIVMFTNYLDITFPGTNSDCGLRENLVTTFPKRPLFAIWGSLQEP